MVKEIICTVCPTGCHITVEGEGTKITAISGNTCKRGYKYAESEFVEPLRTLTGSVRIDAPERAMLPVRTTKPIPLAKFFDCMKLIKAAKVTYPVHTGDVIIADILGTGADVVSAMTVGEDK